MITGRDVLYANEIRKVALATAERERLIHQLEKPRSSRQIPYQLWLARLGTYLVAWGQSLQTRYASS